MVSRDDSSALFVRLYFKVSTEKEDVVQYGHRLHSKAWYAKMDHGEC